LSDWLEQRLSSDLYVQGSSQFDLHKLLANPTTADWLAATNERTQVTLRLQDRPLILRGIDHTAPDMNDLGITQSVPNAVEHWRSLDTSKNWVLANEQLHFLGGKAVGEVLELPTPQGLKTFTIAAFVHDYGNPYYQLYIPNPVLKTYWVHPEPWNISLWLKSPNDLPKAEQALIEAGAKAGDWTAQRTIKEVSLKIFDRTFAMTAAMNSLTLWVAGIALLAALMAILQERLPEFAQWRALGVSTTEQWLVMSTPLLIWAMVTWLVSIPLGALLSWILIHKLNVMAFGWSMPLLWSMQPAGVLALMTAGVIGLTLVLVAWQLKRQLPQALARLGGQA
jgi:putative ABC transport system permease protein